MSRQDLVEILVVAILFVFVLSQIVQDNHIDELRNRITKLEHELSK
jgi:hypothetical protein